MSHVKFYQSVFATLLFFCSFYVSITVNTNSLQNKVTVFAQRYFNGANLTVDISNCANSSSLHYTVKNDISSINSHGNCVNLYKSDNCEGEYVLIAPGTPVHYDLSHWNGLNDNINSLGPCYPRCDPRSFENKVKGQNNGTQYLITLYDDLQRRGSHVTMNLTANSCTLVPLHLKRRISSLQVHGNFCIELHHTWNCVENGTFAQLRPGSPKYDDLRFWVGHDNQAVSISLCGYDCHNETKVESSNGTQNNITNNSTVTIFDEDDALFNGHFKNLNLSQNACLNLNDEWDGQTSSIKTNLNCIQLFDEFNCSTTPRGRNFTIYANFTRKIAFLKTWSFDRIAQSIMLCNVTTLSQQNTGKSGRLGSGEASSGTTIFFIVLFCFVGVSVFSVGAAWSVTRLRSGVLFRRRSFSSVNSHSLMF